MLVSIPESRSRAGARACLLRRTPARLIPSINPINNTNFDIALVSTQYSNGEHTPYRERKCSVFHARPGPVPANYLTSKRLQNKQSFPQIPPNRDQLSKLFRPDPALQLFAALWLGGDNSTGMGIEITGPCSVSSAMPAIMPDQATRCIGAQSDSQQ